MAGGNQGDEKIPNITRTNLSRLFRNPTKGELLAIFQNDNVC